MTVFLPIFNSGKIENKLKQILASYSFSEIRTPIVEQTALFSRAIGEVTDVVEKRCIVLMIGMATV